MTGNWGRLKKGWAFVALTCLLFTAYFLWLQLRRYAQLGAYAFDLGIFQQAVWLMSQGKTPFVTVRGMNILGDHFSPILYLLAIPYRFWAHPFWLFFAQTIALAAGAFPLYQITLRHAQKEWVAVLVAISYLLHPALFAMPMFDFHPVLLSVPFLLWAMDALDANRPVRFAIASFGAMLCKEEVALGVFCLSAYGALVRRLRWAWWSLIGSAVWIWIVLKLMAYLAGAEKSAYLVFYARWGNSPFEILLGIFSRPIEALKALLLAEGHATDPGVYPILLLVPFAFFPLLAPEVILFWLPNYALIALSERVTMRELGYQYASTLLPWLAFAGAIGFVRLARLSEGLSLPLRLRWQFFVALTWIFCAVFSAYCYRPPAVQQFMVSMVPPEKAKTLIAFLNRHIPPDASVTAPTSLVPPLAHRERIYLFPNPFQQVAFGPSVEALKHQMEMRIKPLSTSEFHERMKEANIDYIVLKARTSYWPLGVEVYDTLALHALTCPVYGVVAVYGDLLILRRGADFFDGLKRLGVKMPSGNETLRQAIQMKWKQLKAEGT